MSNIASYDLVSNIFYAPKARALRISVGSAASPDLSNAGDAGDDWDDEDEEDSVSTSGYRAAMWAGLAFGNLFVTYDARGSFVGSFYGSASAAAEAGPRTRSLFSST